MKARVALLFVSLICAASSGPTDSLSGALLVRQGRDLEILTNTKDLIVQLVTNLRKAAEQALDSVVIFSNGIQEQVKLFITKLFNKIEKLKEQINEAINRIKEQILTSVLEIYNNCIQPREVEINNIIGNVVNKTMDCANDQISHINDLIEEAKTSSIGAISYSENVIADMKNCTDGSLGIIDSGKCLGLLAFNTEIKAAVFVGKSALLLSRINIGIATLPASLEICAGGRIVEAGVGIGKSLLDMATCPFSQFSPNTTLII